MLAYILREYGSSYHKDYLPLTRGMNGSEKTIVINKGKK